RQLKQSHRRIRSPELECPPPRAVFRPARVAPLSLTISASSALKPRITHNVILSEAKNLRSNLYQVTTANRQRCFASPNMSAMYETRSNVSARCRRKSSRCIGGHILPVVLEVYVVGDAANSSI